MSEKDFATELLNILPVLTFKKPDLLPVVKIKLTRAQFDRLSRVSVTAEITHTIIGTDRYYATFIPEVRQAFTDRALKLGIEADKLIYANAQ